MPRLLLINYTRSAYYGPYSDHWKNNKNLRTLYTYINIYVTIQRGTGFFQSMISRDINYRMIIIFRVLMQAEVFDKNAAGAKSFGNIRDCELARIYTYIYIYKYIQQNVRVRTSQDNLILIRGF